MPRDPSPAKIFPVTDQTAIPGYVRPLRSLHATETYRSTALGLGAGRRGDGGLCRRLKSSTGLFCLFWAFLFGS